MVRRMSEDLKNRDSVDTATSFGFASVDKSARQGLVNEVFAKVARRYDVMNDLMSGGLHRLWKADLLSTLSPSKSDTGFDLLDVKPLRSIIDLGKFLFNEKINMK